MIRHLVQNLGTELFEYPSSVLIKDEDAKVIKTYPNGFNKTDLDKIIQRKERFTIPLWIEAVGVLQPGLRKITIIRPLW